MNLYCVWCSCQRGSHENTLESWTFKELNGIRCGCYVNFRQALDGGCLEDNVSWGNSGTLNQGFQCHTDPPGDPSHPSRLSRLVFLLLDQGPLSVDLMSC